MCKYLVCLVIYFAFSVKVPQGLSDYKVCGTKSLSEPVANVEQDIGRLMVYLGNTGCVPKLFYPQNVIKHTISVVFITSLS